MDYLLCLVMAFGNWIGAELVFYYLGFVSSASNGHIHVFASPDELHFNLHMNGGVRASIVVRTDKNLYGWIRDRNGHTNAL